MGSTVRQFAGDESGATSIEYALIATFIGLGIIAGATSTGTELSNVFTGVSAGFPTP